MFNLIYVCDILRGAIQNDAHFCLFMLFVHFTDETLAVGLTAAMEHLSIYLFSSRGSEY